MGTTRAWVERRAERRILVGSYATGRTGWTRVSSPRQLPTNHDHATGRSARLANIRVINRRCLLFGPRSGRPRGLRSGETDRT
jgi:hypothetical protein